MKELGFYLVVRTAPLAGARHKVGSLTIGPAALAPRCLQRVHVLGAARSRGGCRDPPESCKIVKP